MGTGWMCIAGFLLFVDHVLFMYIWCRMLPLRGELSACRFQDVAIHLYKLRSRKESGRWETQSPDRGFHGHWGSGGQGCSSSLELLFFLGQHCPLVEQSHSQPAFPPHSFHLWEPSRVKITPSSAKETAQGDQPCTPPFLDSLFLKHKDNSRKHLFMPDIRSFACITYNCHCSTRLITLLPRLRVRKWIFQKLSNVTRIPAW